MEKNEKALQEVKDYIVETINYEFNENIAKGFQKYESLSMAFNCALYRVYGFCNSDGSHYDVAFADVMDILVTTRPDNY